MANVIALKVSAGKLRQFDAVDVFLIDQIAARSGGNLAILAPAGELSFTDVGDVLTLTQAGDRTLIQTSAGEIFDGVTSLVAALNALAAASDLTGQAGIKDFAIEDGVLITAGDTVGQSTVTGRVTQADAAAAITSKFLGISLETNTGNPGGTNKVRVALPGNFIADSGLTATVGNALFLPSGAGRVTTTQPTGTGKVVKRIGWAHETGAPGSSYLIDPAQAVIL